MEDHQGSFSLPFDFTGDTESDGDFEPPALEEAEAADDDLDEEAEDAGDDSSTTVMFSSLSAQRS